MGLRVRIDDGGTNAGHRIIVAKSDPWRCSRGHDNKGYWARCMTSGCNEKRR